MTLLAHIPWPAIDRRDHLNVIFMVERFTFARELSAYFFDGTQNLRTAQS